MPTAIPDIISVVASAYYQPIADLTDKLSGWASKREPGAAANQFENGYSVACVVLLAALLESFLSRVRFKRLSEVRGTPSAPDLLVSLFPNLPTKDVVHEVFLLRNIVVHNHLWHLDVSDESAVEPKTKTVPKDLGFSVNKNYDTLVSLTTRRTVMLGLNVVPTSVDNRMF